MNVTPQDLGVYLGHVLDGDRVGAISQVLGLHDAGVPAETLALDLIAAVQVEVGVGWREGAWGVAHEHRATSISQMALAALAAHVTADRRPGPRRPVVVACTPNDWHSLPAELVGYVLDWRGWEVTFLAPPLPPSALQQFLLDDPQAALLLSCSSPARLHETLPALEAARRAGVPVLAGGRGFGDDKTLALRLGASGWARTVADADALLHTWEQTPPVVQEPDLDLATAAALLVDRDLIVSAAHGILRDAGGLDLSPDLELALRDALTGTMDVLISAVLTRSPQLLHEAAAHDLPGALVAPSELDVSEGVLHRALAKAMAVTHPRSALVLLGGGLALPPS